MTTQFQFMGTFNSRKLRQFDIVRYCIKIYFLGRHIKLVRNNI